MHRNEDKRLLRIWIVYTLWVRILLLPFSE